MFTNNIQQNKLATNVPNVKKGFTIVELIITLLVIGLLFSITVRSIDSLDLAKFKGDLAKIHTVITATSMYQGMHGDMVIDSKDVIALLHEKNLVKTLDFKLNYFQTNLKFVECTPGYVNYNKIKAGFWEETGGVFTYTPSQSADNSISYGLCISITDDIPGAINPPNTIKQPVMLAGLICGIESTFDDNDARTGLGRTSARYTQTPVAQVTDALFKDSSTGIYYETYAPIGAYSCLDLINEFVPYNYGVLALRVAI